MLSKYYHWLHGMWPAGKVEKIPIVGENGTSNIPGVRIVGDLSGIPLLKFSSETGVKAVRAILKENRIDKSINKTSEILDLAIIGAGVSGLSAAIEAKKNNLNFKIFEASQAFDTVKNFPKSKPIYTYPTEMTPSGGIQYNEKCGVKESLLEEMQKQIDEHKLELTKARIERIERKGNLLNIYIAPQKRGEKAKIIQAQQAIVAIGRSGNFRKLGVPGEKLDKVSNRLHDPQEFTGKKVAVVGGGDSALEASVALTISGADVSLIYRGKELSRPKPENVNKIFALAKDPNAKVGISSPKSERITTSANSDLMDKKGKTGKLTIFLGHNPVEITESKFKIREGKNGEIKELDNDAVFAMIGREPPTDFFQRSGIKVFGERGLKFWLGLGAMVLFMTFLYQWKKSGTWLPIAEHFAEKNWFPHNVPAWWVSLGESFANPKNILGTIKVSLGEGGFYYSTLYCLIMLVFGIRRINRRRTPYVKLQTWTLILIQFIPLFLLPYIVLPLMGHNGWFDAGVGKWFADTFFPVVDYTEHGREYWRAFGFILAWPLFFANVFSHQPLWGWLILSIIQTFIIIPIIVRRWGKGAYCGWICSCGGMAETLGDAHRHKMPHGPGWNKLNMIGQFFLLFAFVVLLFRVLGWALPNSFFGKAYVSIFQLSKYGGVPVINYSWFVDLLFAGIIGFGFYFHYSGRVWCRFACPLAALMHIYHRAFGKFRIFPDKKKCISCNICTSVCHQGIDIMNFANKGMPMSDPECVRCSACVQQCPTGVLTFGRLDKDNKPILDKIKASNTTL